MTPVGVGIIGMGEWARTVHIPNLLRVKAAHISALASRDSGRLQEAGRLARTDENGPALYSSYQELLRDPAVDAVIVCTPNHQHEAMTMEALAAGKHVLSEKPLSFTLEGCRRVHAAASESGKIFQVGLELRYSDVATKVRALIRQGVIGTPRMVSCDIWRDWGAPQGWRAGSDSSGGIYLELAVHYLDLLDWLVGGGNATVVSSGGQALGTEITDHLWTTVRYASGALVNLGIAIFAPAENLIPIAITGEKGRITADVITGTVEVWLRDGTRRDESPPRLPDYRFDGFPGSVESLEGFVQSVHTSELPLAGIAAATRSTALALAAQQAEASGEAVQVP